MSGKNNERRTLLSSLTPPPSSLLSPPTASVRSGRRRKNKKQKTRQQRDIIRVGDSACWCLSFHSLHSLETSLRLLLGEQGVDDDTDGLFHGHHVGLDVGVEFVVGVDFVVDAVGVIVAEAHHGHGHAEFVAQHHLGHARHAHHVSAHDAQGFDLRLGLEPRSARLHVDGAALHQLHAPRDVGGLDGGEGGSAGLRVELGEELAGFVVGGVGGHVPQRDVVVREDDGVGRDVALDKASHGAHLEHLGDADLLERLA